MRWPSGECASLWPTFIPGTHSMRRELTADFWPRHRAHTLHTLIKKRSSFTFQVHTPIRLGGNGPNDRTVIGAKLFLYFSSFKVLNGCGLVTFSSQEICVHLNNCKCVAVYLHNSLPYTPTPYNHRQSLAPANTGQAAQTLTGLCAPFPFLNLWDHFSDSPLSISFTLLWLNLHLPWCGFCLQPYEADFPPLKLGHVTGPRMEHESPLIFMCISTLSFLPQNYQF